MTEHEAYVAFNMVPNVGSVRLEALVKSHGSAAAAWEAFPGKKNWEGKPVDWNAEIALADRKKVTLVDCTDPRYPLALNDLPSKPLVLYVAGNADVLSVPGVAVVGTRLPTLYGADMAQSFAAGIAGMGMSVISGLATGIDSYAHRGALAAGGITVGILGGALDRFFPEENRELGRKIVASGGAVICEYPFGFPPGRKTFPQRNRIVAALARGVLAVETPVQGGTLITCGFAKKLGRALMAVPGNLDSKSSAGCWKLIREGATMVTCSNDIAAAVGAVVPSERKMPPVSRKGMAEKGGNASRKPSPPAVDKPVTQPGSKPRMSIEESVIMNAIPSTGITLERLAFITKLPASNVAEATMSLRLKKLIRFLPGNRVAPVPDGALVD
jgi:DNA processing protein